MSARLILLHVSRIDYYWNLYLVMCVLMIVFTNIMNTLSHWASKHARAIAFSISAVVFRRWLNFQRSDFPYRYGRGGLDHFVSD